MTGKAEIIDLKEKLVASIPKKSKYLILPLYSMLPPHKQVLVFQSVPEDVRLIVICTNVAETSITIPNIKYVVDCGREKKKIFDPKINLSQYVIQWIS